MQTISVQTTQNVTIHHPLASVGDRILAYLLDMVILIGYTLVLLVAFINMQLRVVWVWVIFLAVPWMLYHLAFEIFMNGQSPGKRVMNIQVVRLDGTQPTIGNYVLRWVFSFIDFYLLTGAIAVIVIATSGRGQRIGDIVAGTTVVKLVPQRETTASNIFITPENSYVPVFPRAAELQSRDIELIQRALDANIHLGNPEPMLAVSAKVRALLEIESDLNPDQFLHTIVKDYNHLNAR